jgi:hypothetical protein
MADARALFGCARGSAPLVSLRQLLDITKCQTRCAEWRPVGWQRTNCKQSHRKSDMHEEFAIHKSLTMGFSKLSQAMSTKCENAFAVLFRSK